MMVLSGYLDTQSPKIIPVFNWDVLMKFFFSEIYNCNSVQGH